MARAKKQIVEEVVEPKIDVATLIEEITRSVTKKLTAEFDGKMQVALQTINSTAEQRRDRIVLTGAKPYAIDASDDGLLFSKENDVVLLVGKNGQLATGTKSPRSYGKGSAHFRAGYTSEADLPSSGDGSTRGVIVEGDGDDEKTFVFRAVSRMNRQGFNVFSDGSIAVNSMSKVNDATFGVYHRFNDTDAVSIDVPTLEYDHTAFNITSATPINNRWNAVKVTADNGTDIFKVDGAGAVFANNSFYSNGACYAEMFEWADGNSRNENRNGFTVAFDANGKLRVADEGDPIVGVVVPHAAFVGNSMWNHWHSKYAKKTFNYTIVEWLEMETTKLKSFYKQNLSKDFALPENAVEIQTDEHGNDLCKHALNPSWDKAKEYTGREKRNNWAIVCILGSAPVYKGQLVNNNWIKVKDLNDELELVIIK